MLNATLSSIKIKFFKAGFELITQELMQGKRQGDKTALTAEALEAESCQGLFFYVSSELQWNEWFKKENKQKYVHYWIELMKTEHGILQCTAVRKIYNIQCHSKTNYILEMCACSLNWTWWERMTCHREIIQRV